MGSHKNKLVEEILKDFPRINKSLVDRKAWLESMSIASGDSLSEHVSGGATKYQQDRYLDTMNEMTLSSLQKIIDVVYSGFKRLSDKHRRVIALEYWRRLEVEEVASELKFTPRYTYQLRSEALIALYKPCLSIADLVDDWRQDECNELNKVMRFTPNCGVL